MGYTPPALGSADLAGMKLSGLWTEAPWPQCRLSTASTPLCQPVYHGSTYVRIGVLFLDVVVGDWAFTSLAFESSLCTWNRKFGEVPRQAVAHPALLS